MLTICKQIYNPISKQWVEECMMEGLENKFRLSRVPHRNGISLEYARFSDLE